MKNYKRIVSIVLLIAVTICSILPTGLEARAADVTESNPMYRLYNPNSGEHFYTADEGEKDYLSGIGWNYEGIGWNAPVSSNSPVYRLYNPYSSDHHYTMDEGERDYLSQTGWNYEGIGWYSDDAKSVPLYRQFNPNEVIGTHNYTTSLEENDWLCTTGWQAEGIGWYGVRSSSDDEHENEPLVETEKSVENYAVINLEVDSFTESVNAKVGAPGNCKLLVRFVPEDVYFADGYYSGKEYINDGATQASCDVTASDEFVEVSSLIDNADALPDNFVVEAVLVDANGNNLCSPYTSIENTRRHEEFEAKDIYSFEGHNVVNFDQDATTNFGVLEDDVKILTAEEVVEEVNEDESKNYTITSPSENMEVGDKVYIKDGAGEYLFKVAEKNTLPDGRIFIKAARANDANHGFKLEDFFTYIDYETIPYETQINEKFSRNKKMEHKEGPIEFNSPDLDVGNFIIGATVNGNADIYINIEFDIHSLGRIKKCDFRCEISTTETLSVKPKVNDKIKKEFGVEIPKVPIEIIPFFIEAYVQPSIKITCSLSAEFIATGRTYITAGFSYDSVRGANEYSQKDTTWEINVKGKAEIKIGPAFAVGVQVIEGLGAIELEAFAGIVAYAELDTKIGNVEHACDTCLKGGVNLCVNVSLKFLLIDFDFIGNDPYEVINVKLINVDEPLFDFYVSLASPKDSMFHGEVKCGKGECPNRLINDEEKIDIEVTDVPVKGTNPTNANCTFEGSYPTFKVKTSGYDSLQKELNRITEEERRVVEYLGYRDFMETDFSEWGEDSFVQKSYSNAYVHSSTEELVSVLVTEYDGSLQYTYNIIPSTGTTIGYDEVVPDKEKAFELVKVEMGSRYDDLSSEEKERIKNQILQKNGYYQRLFLLDEENITFIFDSLYGEPYPFGDNFVTIPLDKL